MLLSGTLAWLLGSWLALLAALVAYRLLTGSISLRGVLSRGGYASQEGEGGKFSPERAQLLMVTLGGLATYVTSALSEHQMPQVDNSFLVIFALSHAVYLSGKAARR